MTIVLVKPVDLGDDYDGRNKDIKQQVVLHRAAYRQKRRYVRQPSR